MHLSTYHSLKQIFPKKIFLFIIYQQVNYITKHDKILLMNVLSLERSANFSNEMCVFRLETPNPIL